MVGLLRLAAQLVGEKGAAKPRVWLGPPQAAMSFGKSESVETAKVPLAWPKFRNAAVQAGEKNRSGEAASSGWSRLGRRCRLGKARASKPRNCRWHGQGFEMLFRLAKKPGAARPRVLAGAALGGDVVWEKRERRSREIVVGMAKVSKCCAGWRKNQERRSGESGWSRRRRRCQRAKTARAAKPRALFWSRRRRRHRAKRGSPSNSQTE